MATAHHRRAASTDVTPSMKRISTEAFGFDEARHLLWRAGFGGTPQQIQALASMGPERAVEYIVEYDNIPYESVNSSDFDKDIMRPPTQAERQAYARARRENDEEAVARVRAMRQERQRSDRRQVAQMQNWWLKRLIETPRPLEEKMTLFWHGHFATSYRTIEDSYHMFMQNQLFRDNATGNYGELMYNIIRDPAMIAYLDNNDSRKDKPNENLARELMELFSLGEGNYTERDIKEGARALTGYTFQDDEFVFQERNHDDGVKRILGKRGRLDGDGFVTAILENRDCSRYMATKLYRFFVGDYPTGATEADEAAKRVISDIASNLLRSRYELRPVLTRLFESEHFYSGAVRNEKIKSPAELVVGTIRSLLTPTRDLGVLSDAMNLMGQDLFFPPSVAGWEGGRSWINTSTLFVRQNTTCFLLTGRMPRGYHDESRNDAYSPGPALATLREADPAGAREAERVASYLLKLLIGRDSATYRESLTEFVADNGGRLTDPVITGMILLVSAMPEYQLC